MKIILFLILSVTFLFANSLIVKDANVTLLINGQEIELEKDHNLTLDTGTMVCFFKGNGKVIIDNIKQLDKNSPDCYQIPVKDDFDIKAFLSSSKNKSVSRSMGSSSDSHEVVIHRGAEASDEILKPVQINISSSDKEVIIYDESFGPLPVTLSIKKSDGTMVKEVVNEDSIKTLFRVPTAYLENNSKIEVTNAFGDKLLKQQVTIDSTSKPKEKHDQVYYEKKNHTIVDILYGTDRKINPKEKWEDYYTGERGKLKFGIAEVSIPKKHKFGEMESPNKWLFWQKEKIGEHVIVVKLEDINKKDFTKFLSNKLKNVTEKDILIFIHGFNVTFTSAIRRTAQISYDLKFKGVPMTYSWPSQGDVNSYMRDESSIQYTVPHLLTFLQTIIENKKDANIHLIGHSMGTRALTNALKEISYIYPNKHVFKNIILAAPDIDKDVFIGLLPFIKKTTEQITLYVSSDDTALKLSETLHSGERIGQDGGDNIFVIKGLDTIDATGIDTSLLGHSYFAEKEVLLNDLKDVIHKSLPPSKRKSLIEKIKAKLIYWKFIFENR